MVGTIDGKNSVRTWQAVIGELSAFRALTDDWDGDGSLAPKSEVIDAAMSKALQLQNEVHVPPDRVIAGVNGTVIFEWLVMDKIKQIEVR